MKVRKKRDGVMCRVRCSAMPLQYLVSAIFSRNLSRTLRDFMEENTRGRRYGMHAMLALDNRMSNSFQEWNSLDTSSSTALRQAAATRDWLIFAVPILMQAFVRVETAEINCLGSKGLSACRQVLEHTVASPGMKVLKCYPWSRGHLRLSCVDVQFSDTAEKPYGFTHARLARQQRESHI